MGSSEGVSGRGGEWSVSLVAAGLVLAASYANFLAHHGYPAMRPEVLMVGSVLAVAAGIFALLYRRAGDFGQTVLEVLLTLLAVDLNSNFIPAAAAAAAVVAVLRLKWGLSVLKPMSIIAIVVLATSVFGLGEHRPAVATTAGKEGQANRRPAILHVILDEHGGLGGIKDPGARRELAEFYTSRGFRLFERAYSRHFRTVNAVPDALNFGGAKTGGSGETLDIGRTAYLTGLQRQGYRLHIYQSDFVDFCQHAPGAQCTSYWSPSLGFIADQPLPASEKARLIGFKFAALSGALVSLGVIADGLAHLPVTDPLGLPEIATKDRALSTSTAAFAMLDRMAGDLASAQPGDAFFAHILAPHYPYVADRNCRLRPPSQWEFRRSPRPIELRRSAYHQQVACVMKKIDRLAAAFLASPAGKNGIIVVHGDHGSRIAELDPNAQNADKLSADDLLAGYSTLFAVRGPGIPPGLDTGTYATPQILGKLAATGFRSVDGIAPGEGNVYLDGPGWTVGKPVSITKAWPKPN